MTIVAKLIAKSLFTHRQKRDHQLLNLPIIQSALKDGRTIEVIRLLHKNHNMGLKEAKHFIDKYALPPISRSSSSENIRGVELHAAASCTASEKKAPEKAYATGEVWINNTKAHVLVVPYIGRHGFWLHNEATTWGGPHTEIYLTPDCLATSLATADKTEVVIDLTRSTSIGEISDLRGYPAADEGPCTRRIYSVTTRIIREMGRLRFEFKGETDYLDPTTVRNTQSDLTLAGRYAFQIWFEISDADLHLYFKDQVALDAVAAYANRVKWNSTNG